MQTFLPYPDFVASSRVLDWRRLGKQRVEAFQIWKALMFGGAWARHPAVRMWRGYEQSLLVYHDAMIREWIHRGYRNNMPFRGARSVSHTPPWLGDEAFHRSHQSNLLRKDYAHYSPHFPGVPTDLPYIWPASE